ncbi:ribonuclease, Rne/Rng family [Thermincola ferriacetica]|uniref:Ribonuclease G n=1 Tax=Thermincola ferriacetica TaxID=281456 RepID=A0A0L6W1Z1_9FIRM|nr:Rne/Rng family ribonuclease [Thermincola ferriacetica]KNZ69555.1 ribonuclease, Rne/Rng family [Thermincola ferriacetica]
MLKEILVNVREEETRVAVLEDKVVVEIYIERSLNQRLVGNIYKGKVENVLPGMQAAFVDIGLEKNAFLFVEDAVPPRTTTDEEAKSNYHVNITDVLKEGQEILVQIAKEPIGTKGARVTTHITLPGRYLVLMPTVDYIGISRRIENESERERLKALAEKVKPANMGLIVRTIAEGMDEEELVQDVTVLTKLWKKIQNRSCHGPVPNLIHKDLELVQRILRDIFTEDIDNLVIDSRYEYEKVLELMELTTPQLKSRVSLYEQDNLFEKFGVDEEIEKILKPRVWLKCGGYIVIDQTEALTAIDVNTGKYVGSTNLADTVLKTNLDAAVEIARQLRLRNIGGIIIVDFIDMPDQEHQRMVLQKLEEEVRKDKTKTNVLGLTQLGLVEMTRKKVRQGLENVLLKPCPYCDGRGKVLSEETISIRAKNEIFKLAQHTSAEAILVEVHPSVASLLIGSGGAQLRELEAKTKKSILIRGCEHYHQEVINIRALYSQSEIEAIGVPVRPGQILEVRIEEPHASNVYDGIGRVNGFIVDVEGASALIGETVPVEITKVYRTYCKARVVDLHK